MKNLAVVLSSIALVGVIALFAMRMDGGNGKTEATEVNATDTKGRIAYVNIDTLQEHYEYFKVKKEELEAKQKSMSNELARSQKKFEKDYLAAQRKMQAGTMTQAEYESTVKRLEQMGQSLKSRDAALTEQLLEQQDTFNKDLQDRLDAFLKQYNEDKGYDYILTYSKSIRTVLLANEALNVTQDVIDGMNKAYSKEAK